MKNKQKMLKTCVLKTLKKHTLQCVCLAVVVVGIMLLSLAPAYILRGLIDNILAPLNNNKLSELFFYAIAYLATLAFIGVFELLKQVLLVYIGENITKNIRLTLANKLDSINALYFSGASAGQITSIFINDVDTINTIFTDGLISLLIDLLKIIGIVVSMFIFSPILGFCTLVLVPIIYLISRAFKIKMFGAQLKNRQLIARANNHISESVKTKQMLKLYSLENYMLSKYNTLLDDNFKAVESVNFYDSIYSPIIKTIMAVIITLLLTISGINLSILGLSVGMLAGSVTLIESLFSPVENLGMELQNLQSAMSGIKRVSDFLAQSDDYKKLDYTLNDIIPNATAQIKIEDLSFSYDSTPIISHLNKTINSGEKVTFIGRTGVGKTTLFKLITGLIKGDGAVTINGIDVCSIKNELKPYIFGYVEQSFSYISGSIKDNITLNNAAITDKQVIDALNFVLLGDFISRLADGIYTPFDPKLFSQGERQLLSVARAIIYNPPILLLDEVTANLDPATEQQILTILQKASSHTILTITHRPHPQSPTISTIKL